MDRASFARVLQQATVAALQDFRHQTPHETPYALAIIQGQVGNYLGYAIATEEGLQRVAAEYAQQGYRYQGESWEVFDNHERLATMLRWANPDDGWRYGDFADRFEIAHILASLVEQDAFGENANELDEFCTEVLSGLQGESDWLAMVADKPVMVGVTYGTDPADFIRTAMRANRFADAQRLWGEFRRGEGIWRSIRSPCQGGK